MKPDKKGKEENDMVSAETKSANFSLSKFILSNKSKIEMITPKNPSIKKDDEWEKEDFWDKLYEEKNEK